MKALVLKDYLNLVYEEVAPPEIGERDVLVRVEACGICGSDVHGLDGSTGRRIPPLIMGHEAAGVIAETGPGVEGWKPGERVTFDSTIYCGKCWYCRRGEVNLCDDRRVLGVSCGEYRQNGAFAEYVAVPAHILYRLPEAVSFEEATMVEALSIAVHGAKRAPVNPGEAALVVGAGTIGLLVIQVLKAGGCSPVIAADIDQSRLARALTGGADVAVNSGQSDLREIVARHTDRGADVAVDAVGTTASIQAALSALRKGGSLTLIGNFSPQIDLALQSVVGRELTVRGSCASSGEYPACLDLIARKVVDVAGLISAVAPLSEGASWFRRLYDREAGLLKVVLKPYGSGENRR
jgi:L-iditol 2-dehydrogenase